MTKVMIFIMADRRYTGSEKGVASLTVQLIKELLACMATDPQNAEIQEVQTAHRLRIARAWDIREGERILEIGCGQGDMTAVLAHLAGPEGFVHGIDIGPESYGAPYTLGQAAAVLSASPLGGRIRMDFSTDVLSPELTFGKSTFDRVVLAHSSWYMDSRETLEQILKQAKEWAPKLSVAEWDVRIGDIGQYAHLLSVLIQAQLEAFKTDSMSNIRTMFAADDLREIARSAGWHISDEHVLTAERMQDGEWEAAYVLQNLETDIVQLSGLPTALGPLLLSQQALLRDAAERHGIRPLDVFAFSAN